MEELNSYLIADLDSWTEGWKPENLAFRYFNVAQEYKTKYDVSI